MPSLALVRVAFAYSDDVPLFSEVELRLGTGWTGVVGANGAGKTTLLRLLSGDLEPEAGWVRRTPAGLRAVLCEQTIDALGDDIRAFAAAGDGLARRWAGLLGLDATELERWPTLSPGERKRWQIGAALAADPALLLLDEPTNHLDASGRRLLAGALGQFSGIGVVVSHDRALLNQLTRTTVRIHRRQISSWTGCYDAARASWEAVERGEQRRWSRLRGEQRKLAHRVSDRRRERARAEARMRTSKRMKSPKDSDARARFKAKRRRSAEVSLGREIHKVHHKIERVAGELAGLRFERELGRSLFVDYRPAPKPRLLELRAERLCAGELPVLRNVDLWVDRDSRIRVAGVNGAGKTTLLRALLDAAAIPRERLLHLPQELDPGEGVRLLEALRALPERERGRVLGVVAALGVDPERLLRSRGPSPGEARKLALAWGLGQQAWLLALDEPTNHLDLPSIERLEEALAQYPGALLMVTHDDAFALRCTHTTWLLAEGRVGVR